MINLGILVSGSGTNLQAIIDTIEAKRLDAKIKIVISNNPDAFAIERAKKYHIPTFIIQDSHFPSREESDKHLVEILKSHSVDLIALAGFMRLLTPAFIRAFPLKILNIHPALLPAFPGLRVQKKAVEYGVKFSGCSVHIVDEGVDTGPIVIQAVVPVHENDTEKTLAERILKEEHRIYPQAIQFFAENRVEIKDRKVMIKDSPKVEGVLENPPVKIFK
ncbi:MAG: phosphoribosylglycinamide formyltransferase [Deltaproteobacteria bacterium GWC2_42_51]|nr:MAG: phosphoribosylglycinamide formyltransferase [Deltaproteobacteria bacterium GWC2_42_51]OGP42931.1 MAG: phosphoribosylglycinamide formyltransferase [Deltaproteobacteria bacterium GWD2_42_10]OGP48590.1 MAG: phosphoribosylglycinamide formyltransferase [Deltaproteobacteria bacterium GWF2_42_12]OGQ30142.1 MAG: phosphoribosylglycinamide formyltransferase [Deltaproteobacteria bacterium RIFCSPHIGHO2_02_FULL_42_44]OGQ67327.1 MAG: phosphoribosylglycinamide formyltransferase [Deltaproteobacteria ba